MMTAARVLSLAGVSMMLLGWIALISEALFIGEMFMGAAVACLAWSSR